MKATTKVVTEIINGRAVNFDVGRLLESDDLYFNATEIAKGFGKEMKDWLKLKETKEYVRAFIKVTQNHLCKDSALSSSGEEFKCDNGVNRGISAVLDVLDIELIIIKRGKNGGTWLHKDLAIQFTRWIDIEFSVMCDIVIKKLLENAHNQRDTRLEAKTGYRPLTDAIQQDHDIPKFYHFSNEANMLNKIVTGLSAKEFRTKHNVENVRDNLSPIQLKAIAELQTANTTFINFGFSYQDRKTKLEDYYITKLLPRLVALENK